MTDMLNESMADKIVIKNLLKELKKRGYMGKILVDPVSGEIYHAVQFELLTSDDLDKNIQESREVIADIERARQFSNSLKNEPATAAPEPLNQPVVLQDSQVLTPPENGVTPVAPVLQ